MCVTDAKLNRCRKLLDGPVQVNRNRTPPRCSQCRYYQPAFRYRRCLFSSCPYGKDKDVAFRKKPLRREKIITNRTGGPGA